ncbi:SBBP repeat-containing protein, partial [Methanococcus maripaludis]
MNKCYIMIILLLLSMGFVSADELIWNNSYDYASSNDYGMSIAVDGNGNFYIIGQGYDGSSNNIITLKYYANGTLAWNNSYDYASSHDYGMSIAVDGNGNSYITGYGRNGSFEDIITLKYYTNGTLAWNNSYDHVSGNDRGNSIAVDGNGNSYITGYGYNESHNDIITLKYYTNGTLAWNNTYDYASSHDYGNSIAVDGNGNSYITGYGYDGSTYEIITLKYYTNGTLAWNNPYDYNSGNDEGKSIAVDGNGNSYITGYGRNGSYTDIITLKYYTNGTLAWNNPYDHASNSDYGLSIAVDGNGTAYITGYGVNGSSDDIITLKYYTNGTLAWNNSYDYNSGNDEGKSIAVDGNGNSYITGYGRNGSYTDIITLKYYTNGTLAWNNPYDHASNSDYGLSIAVDGNGTAYITGYGVNGSSDDIITLKYYTNGTLAWNNSYDYASSHDEGDSIAVDGNGNSYITGYGRNGSFEDIITLKYYANGNLAWNNPYDYNSGNDRGNSIAVDGNGTAYITGYGYDGSYSEIIILKYGFLVDTTAPVVIINTLNQTYNYNTSLNVTVTDSNLDSVVAEINGATNITLTKIDNYYGTDHEFDDGSYTVRIYANDTFGNVNSTETIQFMVDTTGPEFTIHSPINTTVYTVNHFMVNITAEDPCGVDNIKSDIDGWVNTLAEYPTYYYIGYTGMPDENYTIIFTAMDNLGNTAVKEIYVIVDTKPPEITINYPINGSYNTMDMFINATLTDLSGIKNATAELNGINYPLNENNDYYTLNKTLFEGDYTLKVYATDNNNNTNVSDVVAFTIDTTYPEVTIKTSNISDSKNLAVNVTATDEKSKLSTNISVINAVTGDLVDSTLKFTNGTYQVVLSVTADGTYNITASTTDAAGNINTTEPITVLVDTTVPAVTINHEEDDYNHSKNILNVTVNDATLLSVIAEITNETISRNITLENISGYFGNSTYEFAQGEYFVRIYAEDIAGNVNSSETIDFMVDWIAPEVSISNPVNGSYTGVNDTELNFTITDNVCESVMCNISVNGNLVNSSEANTSLTLTYNLTLNEGENNITISAIDDVGNIGESTNAVTVDTTFPTVVINTVEKSYNYNSSILNVTATDTNLDSVVAEIN